MSLRSSSYNIHVRIPGVDDKVLLVHGLTGAIDLVGTDVDAYLRAAATHAPDKPLHGEWADEEAATPAAKPLDDSALAHLAERGYLTTRSKEDEHSLVAKGAAVLHQRMLTSSFDYVVIPTYGCNLRCGYCFQDHMRTDPKYRHLLTRMSPAMVDRIFAAMPALERAAGATDASSPSRSLTLFGGEPLLAENVELIRYIIERSRAAGITDISAISNATELDAYADLLGPDAISDVQITLDGPPDVHDQRRIYADGAGSFAKIANNIDLALARGANVAVRVNADRENVAQLDHLARVVIERGWSEHPRFIAYTAVVAALNDQTPASSTFNAGELSALLAERVSQSPELAVIQRPSDGLRRKFMKVFEGTLTPHSLFSASYCGAHTGMYVFDAFGDIYKCWEKTGDPSLRIGTVCAEGGVELRTIAGQTSGSKKRFLPVVSDVPNDLATWQSRTIATNDVCSKCRYAFFCGGGCATNAIHRSGTYYSSYCNGFQTNFRRAVADAYLAHSAGERSTTDRSLPCGV
jgi:uncharacterized protein